MKTLWLCLFMLIRPAPAAPKPLHLEPELKKSYIALLNQAGDFHKAIARGDESAVQEAIKDTQEIIARLYRQVASVPHFHHRIHSHKLLRSLEEQLTVMNIQKPLNERAEKRNIKKLFNSFFELAQVYNLKRDMKNKIFYCPKDRSLWLQSEKKANNPVNPDHKNCGRLVL